MTDSNINEININNTNNNIIVLSDNNVISSSNKSLIEFIMNKINDDKYNIRNLNGEFLFKDKYDKDIFKEKDNSYLSQKYIGILTFKNEEQLNTILINSRFDDINENFINVLFQSIFNFLEPLFLNEYDNDNENISDNNVKNIIKKIDRVNKTLSSFLYVSSLNNAIKKGMFRQYNEFEHNDTKIKGRIDVSRQVIKNQSIQGKVCYTTREYSTDNNVNRMILKTYIMLERLNKKLITNLMASNKDAKKHIVKLKTLLTNIDEYGISDFVNKDNSKITNMVYKEYESLRKVCIGLLKSKGNYTYDVDDSRINGIVIDIDKLWSLYIYKNIIKKLDDALKEKNDETNMFSFMNDKNITKHDFIVNLKNKKIIFDTSYSKIFEYYDNDKLSCNDKIKYDDIINKIYNEAYENNANKIYLIYPVREKDENNLDEHYENNIKKLPLDNNIKLYKIPYVIPKSNVDFNNYKKHMNLSIKYIKNFILNND